MKRQSVPELLDTDSGAPAEIAGALADLRFINSRFGGITTTEAMINKNEPKQESNQATLARYKKEMDEPRMAESTREKNVNQTTRLELEKAAVVKGENESGAAHAQGAFGGEK